MKPRSKKARSRVYWRMQGGTRRAYGDFRDFADVGGRRQALVPRGGKTATDDPLVADVLASEAVRELQERRRNRTLLKTDRKAHLVAFAAYHLTEKARSGRVSTQWLAAAQMHLEAAIEFFCNSGRALPRGSNGSRNVSEVRDRDLAAITVGEVQQYVGWLARRGGGHRSELSASSQRKYLNSLSNLYRRAASEGCVPAGYNPVHALIDKPRDPSTPREARWLEVPDAALLLEASVRCTRHRAELSVPPPMLRAIVGTMLLTGGRPTEILGLEMNDISFERRTVTIRPNIWRGLKTRCSHRVIPLWPQLEEILQTWFMLRRENASEVTSLLFPSVRTSGMVRDLRKAIDAAAESAGWHRGEIRPYAFRHTYCAARLQTLDGGYPVSPWTVAREMGHGGRALVDRVYGHLGEVRHRSAVVEYRVEQYEERLAARLQLLRAAA